MKIYEDHPSRLLALDLLLGNNCCSFTREPLLTLLVPMSLFLFRLDSGPIGDDELWFHHKPGTLCSFFFLSLSLSPSPSPQDLHAGSRDLPAGSKALPVGSKALPNGSEVHQAPSVEDFFFPSLAKATPTQSEALPGVS